MASTSNSHDDEGVDYGDDVDEQDPDSDRRAAGEDMTDEDRELEAMKARVKEMEAEAAKLKEMQAVAEREMAAARGETTPTTEGGAAFLTEEEKQAVDARSIYVGNVSPSTCLLLPYHVNKLTSFHAGAWRPFFGGLSMPTSRRYD